MWEFKTSVEYICRNIKTDNFITTPNYGFIGGIATRGDFYNNWDIQLGMNISNNKIKLAVSSVTFHILIAS
mgnify:CR=1 FL=1